MIVELHSKQCRCGGASFLLPPGGAAHCVGAAGGAVGAVSVPADEWRALGKPRNSEGHEIAVQRARMRATARAT